MPDPTTAAQGQGMPEAGSTRVAGTAVEPASSIRGRWSVTVVCAAAVIIGGCVAAGIAALVPARAAVLGVTDAGALTELALPAVRAVFNLAAALTIGWLLAAAVLVPPQRSGVLDVGGYRAVRAASLAAAVWAAAALALVPLTVSTTYGRPLTQALDADRVLFSISALEPVQAVLIAAVVASLIAVLARTVLRPVWAGALLVASLLTLVPLAASGHAAQASDHDIAVDTLLFHLAGVTLWVGGLVALLGLVRQGVANLPVIAERYSVVALVAFLAIALSGLGNAWVRIAYLPDLWLTDYGRLVLVKTAAIVALGMFGYLQRRRILPALVDGGSRRPFRQLAILEIGVMAATIGVASALSRTATPPPAATAPGDIERALGFDLAGEPTAWRLLTEWRFDWLLGTGALVAAALYVAGVVRLRRRGDRWPTGRLVAWLIGCGIVLLATSSGLGRYAVAQFSTHMIAHMLLGMVAPILLAIGGPVTLALRALPAHRAGTVPGLREAIVAGVHSRPARFMTHPLVVLPLFIGSFFAIYFTPAFENLMDDHIGHVTMNLHFLLVGYLYYWVIIGTDPAPRRVPPMAKLGLLIAALPFHAFFGLALMNSRSAMATDYYSRIGLPWVDSLVDDQRLGGAIAWGATELPIIIVLIALLAQWARSDERDARRSDRRGDTAEDVELDAYNRMLTTLATRDRAERSAQFGEVPPDDRV